MMQRAESFALHFLLTVLSLLPVIALILWREKAKEKLAIRFRYA